MIENDNNTIRAVAWREMFPWLSIARVFRIAIAARCLFFGAAGVLLTGLGWLPLPALALAHRVWGDGWIILLFAFLNSALAVQIADSLLRRSAA